MRFSEKWGDSIDNAVDLALAELKLSREQVTVTVLEEPSKGFLGLGAKLAKVRVEEIEAEKPAPKKPAEKAAPKVSEKAKPIEKKAEKKVKEIKEDVEFAYGEANVFGERPTDLTEVNDHPAKTFLTEMTKEMGLDVNIKVSTNDNSVYVDIDGADSGTVIGKRGQTLDAIQYLTSLVVNKGESGYIRVVLDAEGYRQKREVALEKLAVRLAQKAVRTGKNVRLEPMNPYERKVIHTALQKFPGVNTKSEGEEPYRRVVIENAK